MSAFILPNEPSQVNYSFRTLLDDIRFEFIFRWSIREQAWYFDLLAEDQTPICLGKRLVLNWPLLSGVTSILQPLGVLMALDTVGTGIEPAIDELGSRIQILYQAVTE